MIYLDAAATSLQKPAAVGQAMLRAVHTLSSPGRGGHAAAMRAADTVLDCRMAICKLFGLSDPEQVIFTSNATHSLNIAIASHVAPGDRVVISGYEHNAVVRPLYAMGADIHIAASPLFQPDAAIEAFRRELPGAKIAVCCHVSNVFGYILPIQEIAALCRAHGVLLIVDASQSAGCVPLNVNSLEADYVAMPGHKGLMGPQGTGVLLCKQTPKPFLFGGTGSNSALETMPDFLPDRLEAGTHNMPGIAGLLEGVRFVLAKKPEAILRHERRLTELLARHLSRYPQLKLYRAGQEGAQSGVLSVRPQNMDCEELAERLGRHGIAVRSGLHCAPVAHRTAGTFEKGTVRFSVSPFNTPEEVKKAAEITGKLLKK